MHAMDNVGVPYSIKTGKPGDLEYIFEPDFLGMLKTVNLSCMIHTFEIIMLLLKIKYKQLVELNLDTK